MHQQLNPFVQNAMQLQQQVNPLIQQSLQQGQMMMGEFAKVASISQTMVPVCDDLTQSISSGNMQRALASTQNLRGMSGQLAQSTQILNAGIAQRMDTALFMLGMAEQRINGLQNAIQSMRPQIGLMGVPYQQQVSHYIA
jgi:hypothetical protein